MKSNLKEVLEGIPDFDEFIELAGQIRELSLKKLTIEKDLKKGEGKTFRDAMVEKEYYVNGKQPAISYIEGAYKYTGLNDCLMPLRDELVEVTAELDYLKLKLDVYKSMLDTWRTLSANERNI